MFIRLCGFIRMKINPVFVFDSSYSYLKEKTMKKRAKLRKAMKEKYLNAQSDKDRKKYYHLSENITDREYGDIIDLIKLFGFRYIISQEEADSQCAYMSRNNIVDYIISDDMDMLVFGCNKIIRKFTISPNKKMQLIELKQVLTGLNMSMDTFIQMCILLGSDYADTIEGIGFEKAYTILSRYKSIKNAQQNKVLPAYKYKNAYNYFVNLKYIKVTRSDIVSSKIDINQIREFLFKNGFKDSNTINNHLGQLESSGTA